MKKITTLILEDFLQERENLWLFVPVLLGFGAAFYLIFPANFLLHFASCAALFFCGIILYFLNRYSFYGFIFLGCLLFLAGSFYGFFYQKFFLNYTKITGKIYVEGTGKIAAVQKFVNPINGVNGARILVVEPKLYKAEFDEKQKKLKKKKSKKHKSKKAQKKKNSDQEIEIKTIEKASQIAVKKKIKKAKKISAKTIEKSFVNVAGYQEIDRQFLDYSKNYQQVQWLKIGDRQVFPQAPPKISLNVVTNSELLKVNDVIAFKARLQPPTAQEFPDDFDFNLDAQSKKIGAYGFVIGTSKIVKESEISRLDDWFLFLREAIRSKIDKIIFGDEAAIALAFLIGDQSQISKNMMDKIRYSGLAHLLSISGFHLSLASAICFVVTRFLLSRSEYLALHFDLKKFAAIAAMIGTYFYLQIAASPLPAQRAFIMVFLALLALFVGEKTNAKRLVMTAALALILLNPYVVLNISFQLSFAAILILVQFEGLKKNDENSYFLRRFFGYFIQIIFLSIAIQIATAPFLLRAFGNLALLGFLANILAIPLAAFVLMPLAFAALFLMPFGLEKYIVMGFGKSILVIEKIATFVADLKLSNIANLTISPTGVVLAAAGLLIFCLLQTRLRFVGMVLFCCSLVTIFFVARPDILFEKNQKFFAVNTTEGLIFSKRLNPSKQRQLWMNKMNESEFKTLMSHPQPDIFCDKKRCKITKDKVFLVLLSRNRISEICRNNFDVIVNLTSKYKLPNCISNNKIKIDNGDFYLKGGQFFNNDGSFFTF